MKLKPCPFCGGEPAICKVSLAPTEQSFHRWYIECPMDHYPAVFYVSRFGLRRAVRTWNKLVKKIVEENKK